MRNMDGVDPRGISASAIKRGVAERDDAGETKDEVKRKGEQDRDENLTGEWQLIAKGEVSAAGDEPRNGLDPSGSMLV